MHAWKTRAALVAAVAGAAMLSGCVADYGYGYGGTYYSGYRGYRGAYYARPYYGPGWGGGYYGPGWRGGYYGRGWGGGPVIVGPRPYIAPPAVVAPMPRPFIGPPAPFVGPRRW